MGLTPRQWIIVAVLAAGFIIAAILVAGDPAPRAADAPVDFDEEAWCRAAGAIGARSGILGGRAADTDADEMLDLHNALIDARPKAPPELQFEIARMIDLVMLTRQALDSWTVAEALEIARAQTDRPRVDAALDAVSDALVDCGHPPLN